MPGAQAETPHRYLSLLGLVASGDLGGLTCYKDRRGKIVFFNKNYPAPPPSLAMLTGRARMYFGAEQWRNFSDYQQYLWKHTVDVLSLCMSGYNLWQNWWFKPNWDYFNTIEHWTGINTLLAITRTPPAIPTPEKFELYDPKAQRYGGNVRYARRLVVLPYNTTEYLPFYAHHPDFPAGQIVPTWWTLYGPGSTTNPYVYNRKWCYVRYTSPAESAHANLEMISEWPDGDSDQTTTHIHTKYF